MFTLNCNGRLLNFDKPVVMGFINVTPDSFYNGSRHQTKDAVLRQAEQMLNDGAAILDIGGQSTRPGSEKIEAGVELSRVIEPIEAIHRHWPEAVISIDTFYADVAREAAAAGAAIINDISAGSIDPEMIKTVAKLKLPYVLMHMKGTPQTMQKEAVYTNVTREILDFFISKIKELNNKGIHDIIIDPGFGFGKTIAQNFELLKQLEVFQMLNCPLLLGGSIHCFRRGGIKRFID